VQQSRKPGGDPTSDCNEKDGVHGSVSKLALAGKITAGVSGASVVVRPASGDASSACGWEHRAGWSVDFWWWQLLLDTLVWRHAPVPQLPKHSVFQARTRSVPITSARLPEVAIPYLKLSDDSEPRQGAGGVAFSVCLAGPPDERYLG